MTAHDGMRDPAKEILVVRRQAEGRIDGLQKVAHEEVIVFPAAERAKDIVEVRHVPVSRAGIFPESEHETGSVGKTYVGHDREEDMMP
jgi:hypothetical protein